GFAGSLAQLGFERGSHTPRSPRNPTATGPRPPREVGTFTPRGGRFAPRGCGLTPRGLTIFCPLGRIMETHRLRRVRVRVAVEQQAVREALPDLAAVQRHVIQ